MSEFPRSKITVTGLLVSIEITQEDKGDPRMYDVTLPDEPAGLISIKSRTRDDHEIAFFVEEWPALRSAINTLAALATTHANLMDADGAKE